MTLLCETFGLSRAAFYAEAQHQRGEAALARTNVVAPPRRPRHASAEVVLRHLREVLARETAAVWGVCKGWATPQREGLKGSRKRMHALMRAHGLVRARDREPGEPAGT